MKKIKYLTPALMLWINTVFSEEQKTMSCFKWEEGEQCINVSPSSTPAYNVIVSPVTPHGINESTGNDKEVLISGLKDNGKLNFTQDAVISSPTPVTVK